MGEVLVTGRKYSTDPLYQWDINQVLTIYGLSLQKIPEIHFANNAMERAIVRQSTMDGAGVITVDVPNSLLQKPYPITVYVCIYEGETFETLYKIEIPVKARKEPADYVFIDNGEEIYSFNALENKINNILAVSLERYDEVNEKYTYVADTLEQANIILNEAISDYDTANRNMIEAKTAYENANGILVECETATAECKELIENNKNGLGGKENKALIVIGIILASGWTNKTYSFESAYPVANYNIEIALSNTATADQAEAFNMAQIVSSATTNIITAYGDVPTIDIPIIVKAVAV